MHLDIPNTAGAHLSGLATNAAQRLHTILGPLHAGTRFVDITFEGDVRVTYTEATAPTASVGEKFEAGWGRRMSPEQYAAARVIRAGSTDVAIQGVQLRTVKEVL